MSEENKHWISKVKVIKSVYIDDVENTLNSFYGSKFIIATQIFPIEDFINGFCNIVIYYKVPPEKQKQQEQSE